MQTAEKKKENMKLKKIEDKNCRKYEDKKQNQKLQKIEEKTKNWHKIEEI